MIYHPPHVVHDAYARSIGISDPSRLYTLMAPNVWVMEKRLGMTEMLLIGDFIATIQDGPSVRSIDIRALYKPVWMGGPVWDDGKSALDFKGEPPYAEAQPYSYWLRIDLVDPSERIRYPALAASTSYREGLDLGDLRELYSWDGLSFRLRDEVWGRV
jgi:hypothetical protein